MIVIGVTGGMASGKSTVARMFAGRGIRHVDADALVHYLMRDDHKTIAALGKAFPEAVTVPPTSGGRLGGGLQGTQLHRHLMPPPQPSPGGGGSIDRSALAAAIAQDPSKLKLLEQILHPRVRELELIAIQHARRQRVRAIILDIPLLFETDAHALCDITIAVRAPLAHRRRRAFARPGMNDEKWQKLLARQLTDAERIARADLTIETGIGKAATRMAVKKLMHQLGI